MLLRGKRIRKYWKVFVYLLFVSTIAIVITKWKKQKLIESYSSGLKTIKEVKLTYRHTALTDRQAVINREVLNFKNKQNVMTNEEERYTETSADVVTEKQTDVENKNGTIAGHFSMKQYPIISSPREPEVRHIAFLKVHKAASSTMQNIFFRFGRQRNLTFVFTRQPNYFSRSANRHIPLVPARFRNGYDILCNHAIFNYSIYSSLLPRDTVYIGIVRNPLSVFISAVNYYSQNKQLLYLVNIKENKLQKLIQKPEIYDRVFFSYTKNVMARDFGFPESNNSKRISDKLKELDEIFKMVLIVEHFEESLVLMKRYLNWKMQDILFVPNNVYLKRASAVSVSDLNQSDIKKFKVRNKLDYELYDFFTDKFWKQYKNEPDDIKLEVLHFKKVLEKVSAFCNLTMKEANPARLTIQKSEWNEEFTTNVEDCQFMKMEELKFIQILRKQQGSEIRVPVRAAYQRRNGFGVDDMRRKQFGLRRKYPRPGIMKNRNN